MDRSGDLCTARGANCYKCNKKCDFSTQCHTMTAAKQEPQLDGAFLGPVIERSAFTWTVSHHIKDQELTFKLDTGGKYWH